MSYKEMLKDIRWLTRKREILERDRFTCELCGCHGRDGNELHVHHLGYFKGLKPWEYNDYFLVTLCDRCHQAVHENNIQLSLRRSVISDRMICEEYVEWIRRRNFDYDGVKLFIHGGTCLASDDIGKVFIAADFPFYNYNDGIGEETPFTKRDKHIAVEALATYDKSDDGLAICEYVFPLTGVFGIHPRYATEEERKTILKCFADWTSTD